MNPPTTPVAESMPESMAGSMREPMAGSMPEPMREPMPGSAPRPMVGWTAALFAAVVAVLLAPSAAAASAAAAAVTGPAARPTATGQPPVGIDLTGVSAASISPGSTYTLTGTLRNTTTEPLRALSVRLRLDWLLLTAPDVTGWLARGPSDRAGVVWSSQPATDVLAPGATARFTIGARADVLGLPTTADAFGPRGLAIEVIGDRGAGPDRLALQRTVVVWDPGEGATPTNLAVLSPVTPGARDIGTTAAEPTPDLVESWRPDGRLSRILAATRDTAVAWALDPSLLTASRTALAPGVLPSDDTEATTPSTPPQPPPSSSPPTTPPVAEAATPVPATGPPITPSAVESEGRPEPTAEPAAGAATPGTSGGTAGTGTDGGTTSPAESARARIAEAWRAALVSGAVDRDVYLLPWSDPDLTALAHGGGYPLLAAAQDDALRAAREVFDRDLDYTLAWPVGGLADDATVAMLGITRNRTVVLSPSSLPVGLSPEQTATGRLSLPRVRPDVTALVTDPDLGEAVAAMAGADSLLATQQVLGLLAARSASTDATDPLNVLAALPRDWDPAQPEAMVSSMALVRSASWIHVERLSVARDRTPTPAPTAMQRLTRSQRAAEVPAEHVAAVGRAFDRLVRFAPALDDPENSYLPLRRAALSLVGRTWRRPGVPAAERDRDLVAARRPVTEAVADYYSSISVVTGSAVNLVASGGRLPVIVTSTLDEPVSLVLTLHPSSPRLRVGPPQAFSIGAAAEDGTARASVFVDVAAVSNGNVDLAASLSASGGSDPLVVAEEPIRVRVHHDWENRALAVSGGVLALLFLIGLNRSVRRGRRARVPLDTVPDPDDVALVAAGERAPTPSLGLPRLAATDTATSGEDLPAPPGPGVRQTPPPDAGRPGSATRSLMRSSAVMSAGTLVSRILGLVRAIALSAAIGGLASGDAFFTANTLPNNIFILIGGGALNAVLVPQIVRAAKQNEDGGADYTDRLLTLATVILGGATLLAVAAAPLLVRLYSEGWDAATVNLATAFAVWCLPQIFFYGLYTLYGQVLNARESFGPYMWAPVVNNIVAIAGIGVFIALAGAGSRPPDTWTSRDITVLAGTATLGVVAQALVLVPVLNRHGYRWRPRWGWRGIGLRTAGSVAAWTFAGVLVGQLGFLVISRVVNAAGQRADVAAGRTVFDNAFMIFMLPHSLIAVSVVTAVFTQVSRRAADGDLRAVGEHLSLAVRTVSVATMFATAAFVALGPELTAAMFVGTPRSTTDQYALVATAMMLGVVPYSAQYLFQRVSYAFEDARTPFWISGIGTVLWTAAALAAPSFLTPRWVVVGVGLAMAVFNTLTAALWIPVLRRRLGWIDGPRILSTHLRLLLAAAGAAAIGVLVREGTRVYVRGLRFEDYLVLGAAGGVMVLAYGLLLRALRVRELDTLLEPVRTRLRLRGPGR